ncbi:MAG: flagellar hook-associated protein 3, partial [Gallionella sp.]|nr:flagellar hook-associated protein 3 [Gallionella sp.]
GQAITFDGMRLDIQGAPASGDSFAVTPSSNESVFKTISNLIATLNAPVVGSNLTNGLNRGINNLDNALGNVLTVRATLGLRLNEIDALQTTGEDMGLQLKQTLSQLQDVDYNKAISDLTQQQVTLQAAQKSFTQVANLSLFTYL